MFFLSVFSQKKAFNNTPTTGVFLLIIYASKKHYFRIHLTILQFNLNYFANTSINNLSLVNKKFGGHVTPTNNFLEEFDYGTTY
jgi:hypothetical protein